MEIEHSRWFWAPAAVLALISIASPALAGQEPPPEGKMAVVNGSVITRADFDREMSRVQQRLLSMSRPLSNSQRKEMEKRILESLIDRELLYQESRRQGVTVEETAINEQLSKLKERFPSEAEFKRALSEANLSEAAIKSRFKREMAIHQFIESQFVQKVTVSEKESKAYYDSHPDFFKQPERVRARHILIQVDPGADETQKVEARRKLKEVQEKLQEGENFAILAKEFSEGPSRAKGGI
jgi:peptidyl-prolyl cis-trans isomerase C